MMAEEQADQVICRYRWTVEELETATRYHWRRKVRAPFRWLFYGMLSAILLLGLVDLWMTGLSIQSAVLIVMPVYFLFLRRLEARWWRRRRFAKRPDRDAMIEYRVSPDGLSSVCEGLGESDNSWRTFSRCARTPEGLLLYLNEEMFIWLPSHGFRAPEEVERCAQLVEAGSGPLERIG